jgi:predicted membrane channel-forming protein YqfA (hemolysin III family)
MIKEVSPPTSVAVDPDSPPPAILWLYPELKATEPSQRRERLLHASQRSWSHWTSRVLLTLTCIAFVTQMWVLVQRRGALPVLTYTTGALTLLLIFGVYFRNRSYLRSGLSSTDSS